MKARSAIARGRGSRGYLVLVAAGLVASYLVGAALVVAASGGPRRALSGLFTDAAAGGVEP